MRPHQPTPTPHMKGDNRRQRETRPLQSPRRRPHQPTPAPHMKGDNRRQWETTGDKTTSEPKKPTIPTNTKAARSKVALRTPTVNCLGKKRKTKHYALKPLRFRIGGLFSNIFVFTPALERNHQTSFPFIGCSSPRGGVRLRSLLRGGERKGGGLRSPF